jgi:hypothetical protein
MLWGSHVNSKGTMGGYEGFPTYPQHQLGWSNPYGVCLINVFLYPTQMLTWHGRLKPVKRWEDVPVPQGRVYYNSYDPKEREEVDPVTHDLHDDADNEVLIYDEDGFRVPRLRPIHTSAESWGVLADLTKIRSLLNDEFIVVQNEDSEDDDMEGIDKAGPSIRVDVYPQAGLRTLGHFKATNVPKGFQPILKKLDCRWAARRDIWTPIICGVSCQGYNHAQHCLSDWAGGIEVLHGKLTAAMAGMEGNARGRRIKTKLTGDMNINLPFKRITHKLDKKQISHVIWVEPCFTLNVQGLRL